MISIPPKLRCVAGLALDSRNQAPVEARLIPVVCPKAVIRSNLDILTREPAAFHWVSSLQTAGGSAPALGLDSDLAGGPERHSCLARIPGDSHHR
jgi:hypothetical protein